MPPITFRTSVNDDQVIRPPAGVTLPSGAIEVSVTPVVSGAAIAPAAREAANLRLRQCRVALGRAMGVDNNAIDADLARAYGAELDAS